MEIVEEEIVIVGGGICGLATALALHRKGIKSVVLERSEMLRATGAAVIMQPNGWRALDQLGVASKLRQTAIPIQSGTYISLHNAEKKEIPLGSSSHELRSMLDRSGELRCLKRTDLIKILAHNLPLDTIHFGCQVLSIQLDPITSYPILHLYDGRVVKAKVVIGCDGINSMIANMIGGLNSTKVLSTSIVRGFTNYESNHEFGNEFVVMSNDKVQLGHMPITDNLVYWFVTRKWTSQDSTVSKDPVLIKQSTMQLMKDFPIEALELIKKSDLNSLHLTELRYRPPWELLCGNFRRGRVTVAGDAMHAMGPFLAQGGSASLEDAVVLARCLAQKIDEVEEAFDQYVKERKMRVVWLSMESYLVGTMLDTSSILLKFIAILFMAFLFRDTTGHTSYDCGRL